MSATIVASPDDIPEHLTITRRMHARIIAQDGINPQSRTTRALLNAIRELEAAIVRSDEAN